MKNFGAPHRHVGEIVSAWRAVPICDIDHAAIAQRNGGAESGVTQPKGDIVPLAKMFTDERLQAFIGQDVGAVSDESVWAQQPLGIFNSAARLEQLRLMNQSDGVTSVFAAGKIISKLVSQSVGVDDKRCHPAGNQMIQAERDQWLLKDWYQRLGSGLGEWPQPGPEPCSQN